MNPMQTIHDQLGGIMGFQDLGRKTLTKVSMYKLQINKLTKIDELTKRMSGPIQIFKINSFLLIVVWIRCQSKSRTCWYKNSPSQTKFLLDLVYPCNNFSMHLYYQFMCFSSCYLTNWWWPIQHILISIVNLSILQRTWLVWRFHNCRKTHSILVKLFIMQIQS